MSGIGHLAPALVAKSATPKVPLLAFVIASETNDILYFLFSSVGIEPKGVIAVMDFNQGVKYLTPVSNPYSHGLFMSIIWTTIAAAIAFLFYRDRRISGIIGLAVFSHWILDFLMHSNLPLFFDGSPQVGLGLENSGIGFLVMTIFDILILAAGIAIYFITRKRTAQKKEILPSHKTA
ncbi:MAG: hypothetical protein KBG20_08670 [Caldilineaceae bacterium]|nr:hypothetical protein [Caldilineaceae bacterium]MBP8106976.1 hypothetical protein [Caldilineaceae bacterium]MBP8121790.1 hypothetical protein [Caldilineaceae bacterium]MBP9072358.1 hypothetical protein [Caldilineaceae bacterium]